MRHALPDDLLQAQQDWSATYRQLAEQPSRTELRRRLYRLSTAVFFHVHWQGRRPAAWMTSLSLSEEQDLGEGDLGLGAASGRRGGPS
jgi:hypothetical protein